MLSITFLILGFVGFFASRDVLAEVAWRKYKKPAAALLLVYRNAELPMEIGNFYFGGREYDLSLAERAYRKAARTDPKILWGHYQLARIHFLKGGFDKALEEINKELAANPENLRSLYVRGLIYGFSGKLTEAENDFRRFIEWATKEWAGYNDLGWILSKQGKHQEALAVIEGAFREIADAEENPWLWNSRGVMELNLGMHVRASVSFEHARELAEGLTIADWMRSYPGNNPLQAEDGLQKFRNAIKENIKRTERRTVEKKTF